MVKLILVLAVVQLLFTTGQGLEMEPSNCDKCNVILGDTLPNEFKICVSNETRCTTLGKLRDTVK